MRLLYRGLVVMGVVGLVMASAATGAAQEEGGFDAEALAAIEEAEAQVAEMRELAPTGAIERVFWTPDRVEAWLKEQLNLLYSPEDAHDDVIVYNALDFMPLDTDLWQLQFDLLAEQAGGFYDPDRKAMVVVDMDRGFDALAEIIYVHEFTHALQDQHFDFDALGLNQDPDSELDADLVLARQALIEGDATQIMQDYMMWRIQADGGTAFSLKLFGVLGEIEMTEFNHAPPIINAELLFPYLQGQQFVQDVLSRGGWVLLNAVYERPPLSTEHILHPQQYFDGDEPQIVDLVLPGDALGEGWHLVDDAVLGEFYLREYLAQYIPLSEATTAAEGWGGDRLVVYHDEATGETVWLYRLAWDALGDAREFVDGFTAFAGLRYGNDVPVVAGESEAGSTCWAGRAAGRADVTCLYNVQDATLIVQAPDLETARVVGDLQGLGR
ncbi:MAG: hypothetical protein JXB47_02385 [Anaerolineae bacterium]|nr:hypothetical protein [Anaerolineae bacterium]